MDFEVLSPWGEDDVVPPRAIQPRLTDLNGKTIGLYSFFKPYAPFIMREVERQLKERFPNARFSHYQYPRHVVEVMEDDEFKASFEEWVKGVDTVVTGNGD